MTSVVKSWLVTITGFTGGYLGRGKKKLVRSVLNILLSS